MEDNSLFFNTKQDLYECIKKAENENDGELREIYCSFHKDNEETIWKFDDFNEFDNQVSPDMLPYMKYCSFLIFREDKNIDYSTYCHPEKRLKKTEFKSERFYYRDDRDGMIVRNIESKTDYWKEKDHNSLF